MILVRIPTVTNPELDVLVADNVLLQYLLVELLKQRLELLERDSLVYDNEDCHASRAELEEDP